MEKEQNVKDAQRLMKSRLDGMHRTVEAVHEDAPVGDLCLTGSGVLSIDVKRCVDLLLSWGGPSDWIRVFLSMDDEIERVEYHYADWGYHKEFDLSPAEKEVIQGWIEDYYGVDALLILGS